MARAIRLLHGGSSARGTLLRDCAHPAFQLADVERLECRQSRASPRACSVENIIAHGVFMSAPARVDSEFALPAAGYAQVANRCPVEEHHHFLTGRKGKRP